MLNITITVSESWDNEKEEFVYERYELLLEHSLVALSKWESKFKKAFLGPKQKSAEDVRGYIEAMILTPYCSEWLDHLSEQNIVEIRDYIDDSMTATTFNELQKSAPSREIITSELIYYWIMSYQIPLDVENWHLNRLFTLIKIFNVKNSKPKKMNQAEAAAQRRRINEERKALYGTSG